MVNWYDWAEACIRTSARVLDILETLNHAYEYVRSLASEPPSLRPSEPQVAPLWSVDIPVLIIGTSNYSSNSSVLSLESPDSYCDQRWSLGTLAQIWLVQIFQTL